MREVLIFGNGLGMALDPDYFPLEKGLKDAWDDGRVLSSHQKSLINSCLKSNATDPVDLNRYPESESQLDTLQRIVAACDFIRKIQTPNIKGDENGWLTPTGIKFPDAIRSYIHRAASYFQNCPKALPDSFVRPLARYLLSEHSHVATLNYDKLLYSELVRLEVLKGFNQMIDGFTQQTGFSDENLDRKHSLSQSFYLHLHGSPLYYNDVSGKVKEKRPSSLTKNDDHQKTHIVLTSGAHKPSIISASSVLSAYWKRLDEALDESDGITLFGYSGGDRHLNAMISKKANSMKHLNSKNTVVRVVERLTHHDEQTRPLYWKTLFDCVAVDVVLKDNILEFTEWSR